MPDKASSVAYRQIAQDLRRAILRHDLETGDQLPTEAQLAEKYGVSRQTIRRAFHDLVPEGLVYRVPGRGTFVASGDSRYLRHFGSIEDLMGLSVDTTMKVVSPIERLVNVGIAGRLGLRDAVVYGVTFLRLHDDSPFCYTTVWLPPEVYAELGRSSDLLTVGASAKATVIELVDAARKDPIAEALQSITVGYADKAQADALGVGEGEAVLVVDRLYLDTRRRPVELAISAFLPNKYSYTVNLRRTMGG